MSKRKEALPVRRSKRLRTVKQTTNYARLAKILVESGELHFGVLSDLWQTCKWIQPSFQHVRFYFDDANCRWIYSNSLEEWKIYFTCFAQRGCLPNHVLGFQSAVMANVLILYGHIKLAANLMRITQVGQGTIVPALYLNGSSRNYQNYVETLDEDGAIRLSLMMSTTLSKPPLFNYELLEMFGAWKTWSETRFLTYVLRFIHDSVALRSVVALEYIHLKLSQPLPLHLQRSKRDMLLTTPAWLLEHSTGLEHWRANTDAQECRQWGHPLAVKLANEFLDPLAALNKK